MVKGKFIVLYGINNLGKTTQAKMLVQWLNAQGIFAEYLKYAMYDLEPTGPRLNAYLRKENPEQLIPQQFQELQVQNRADYQPFLEEKLQRGIWVVAEDYVGTGIAWGVGAGVDQSFLEGINSHLLKEDLAFFFDGERFTSGIEKVHTHEQNDELTKKVRAVHQDLAQKYAWIPIDANATIEEIQEKLIHVIKNKFQM
jgi:dTMP kinase